MKFDPDDPRLTAYVLSELSPEQTAEVEARMAADPSLRQEVEAIAHVADRLRAELAGEPCPVLTPGQRAAVEARLATGPGGACGSAEPPPMPPPAQSGGWPWPRLAVSLPVVTGVLVLSGLVLMAGVGKYQSFAEKSRQRVSMSNQVDTQQAVRVYVGGASASHGAASPHGASKPGTIDALARDDPIGIYTSKAQSRRGRQGLDERMREAGFTENDWKEAHRAYGLPREIGHSLTGTGSVPLPRAPEGTGATSADSAVGPGAASAPASPVAASPASGAPPEALYSLTKSYVDKLTSMSPSEREKLKASIARFQQPSGIAIARLQTRTPGVEYGYARPPPSAAAPAEPAPPGSAVQANAPTAAGPEQTGNTEAYAHIQDNPFVRPATEPLSTFSIDVDTASYANTRRFLASGSLPPADAVRIEELVNYFPYDYAGPEGDEPLTVHAEVASCPWKPAHRLVRVAVKGRELSGGQQPRSNLVFLIDVSGSMSDTQKLPLVKKAMRLLVDRLGENDSVAIVVYAGASGLVLPPTSGSHRAAIVEALERLESGGSTNGGAGIQLAYDTAIRGFVRGGNNRVVLCTDGDFNVGVTSEGELVRLIEEKAKTGVFLSVLGFGMGNYKDSALERLADKGNGNYAYIDSLAEARKVLVEQMGGTLVTIAKDVKIQVELNPARVAAYRLLGYENRVLAAQDFNDDTKDAGELGAGHAVTAFYEIVPAGIEVPVPPVDPLRYQATVPTSRGVRADETMTVKLRYKEPQGTTSKLVSFTLRDAGKGLDRSTADFRFAASVASFGMVLRGSPHRGDSTLEGVLALARGALGRDPGGYRREFLELVEQARRIGRR